MSMITRASKVIVWDDYSDVTRIGHDQAKNEITITFEDGETVTLIEKPVEMTQSEMFKHLRNKIQAHMKETGFTYEDALEIYEAYRRGEN